jgi:hypothetical protein
LPFRPFFLCSATGWSGVRVEFEEASMRKFSAYSILLPKNPEGSSSSTQRMMF